MLAKQPSTINIFVCAVSSVIIIVQSNPYILGVIVQHQIRQVLHVRKAENVIGMIMTTSIAVNDTDDRGDLTVKDTVLKCLLQSQFSQ